MLVGLGLRPYLFNPAPHLRARCEACALEHYPPVPKNREVRPWIRNRAASSGCCSVSTLRTTARPTMSRASASTSGGAMRHGAHHSVQKSTNAGTRESRMMPSNAATSTSMGASNGGRAALQDPHRPLSARCSAVHSILNAARSAGPRNRVAHTAPYGHSNGALRHADKVHSINRGGECPFRSPQDQ